jgi:uncharacterized RDD family membrane protein YckC
MMEPNIPRLSTEEVKATYHEIVTPEGVPLRLKVSLAGDRILAFAFDFFLINLAMGAVAILVFLAMPGSGGLRGYLFAILVLALFLIRNFYFIFFELRSQGSTPGKRRRGLRVIDRRGGPLGTDAIFVRNLMREVEFFVPLSILAAPQQIFAGAGPALRLLALGWVLVFFFMPLFNKRRLRIGDLVGGTIVVEIPKSLLLQDIGRVAQDRAAKSGPRYTFTKVQLDMYGIYELQVLEGLLREIDELRVQPDAPRVVSEKIRNKINWESDGTRFDAERFLRDFYTAQRGRLEHKMLMGKRQEYKKAGKIAKRRKKG